MRHILFCLLMFHVQLLLAQTVQYGSFNIRYADGDRGTPNDWNLRRDSLARFVRQSGMDICGMQEVLYGQLTDLEERLPEFSHIGVGRDDGKTKGEYAPIFFLKARWEARASGTFWLSPTPDIVGSKGWDAALPRIATWALLRHRQTGKEVMCVNTHFDHVGQKARVESGKLILQKVRQIADTLPMVLTGDFNVGMGSNVYQSIMHDPQYPLLDTYLMGAPHEGVFYTFQDFGRKPSAQCSKIDFIFISPNIKVTKTWIPAEQREENAFIMSDHNPVIATLELP